jgi:ankyrin repeat protein
MAHSGLLDAVLGGQLRDAVAADNTALIHLLLELDAPVDMGDENDVTTLHLAAGLSDADATELLLRRNAEVDTRDSKGRTPQHWAARRSDADADAVELLVRYGADVNARDSEGRTPLHHAILHKPPATAVVRALLRAGASLRAEKGNLSAKSSCEKLTLLLHIISCFVSVSTARCGAEKRRAQGASRAQQGSACRQKLCGDRSGSTCAAHVRPRRLRGRLRLLRRGCAWRRAWGRGPGG